MTQAVRLDRLLANLGYGSRRDVDAMIRAGRVALDGAVLVASDRKIGDAEAPRLCVDFEPVDPMPGLVLMMHKPVGTICSHDEAGPLVQDLLPARWRRRDPPLSPAGRLDKDTSGLLLLTDDGALLHKIISPKTHLPKRYRATLARPLDGTEAALFGAGTLMLKGESKPLRPARLDVVTSTEAILTIEEGRYHQVRRMFAAVGNHVEALHRESIGGLGLPETCLPGTFTPLAARDVEAIFAIQAIVMMS